MALDPHQAGPPTHRSSSAPQFFAPRPSHVPPATLSDADLLVAIASLRRKLGGARRSLFLAHCTGALLTLAVVGAGFAVLWAGPAPFFGHFLGSGHVTTTYDAAAWWLVLLLLAILGGAFGDQALRGKLRIVQGWRNRVHDLERRLAEAEEERLSRSAV